MRRMIDRRRFLLTFPGLALAPRILGRMARRAVSVLGLNHAELSVSDPARSVELYQGLFGMPIQARQGGSIVLRIGNGPQFMAIKRVAPGQAPSISRLGLAVADFDTDRIIDTMAGSGVGYDGDGMPDDLAMKLWTETRGPEGGGGTEGTTELYLGDPHGIIAQLVHPTHCGGGGSLGNVCAAPEASPVSGVLAVRDLNHFTISVPNPPRANQFYQETFGLPIQAYQASTPALDVDGGPQFLMFSGDVAPRPSVINHFCMTVEGFDTDEILGVLDGFGIQPRSGQGPVDPLRSYISMRMPNRGGADAGTPELYFTDPDGLRVQLQDTTYCGGGGVLGQICS